MNFENVYQSCADLPQRYILPKKLFKYLQQNFSDSIEEIGQSYLEQPIYKLQWGEGNIKILAWSQMHGNESNSTLAMLDLLSTWKLYPSFKDDLFKLIQLNFIFMLNPDGAEKWTRRNALEIDLNRDFLKGSSKEFPLLKQIAKDNPYDYALNLHEQRTLFSTDGIHPATLSFLAPAENVEREVTETRKKSMAVIAQISKKMEELIPNHIARYNDEFYPTSTGDNFTKLGIPTILFEGGHYEEDYYRKNTRKYYTIALYYGLKAMAEFNGSAQGWEDYFLLTENKEDHYDIIYRNVRLNTDFKCVVDVAVQYQEQKDPNQEDISFIPMVVEVGDCGTKRGWKEIDCSGKYFKSETIYPKLNAPQAFEII